MAVVIVANRSGDGSVSRNKNLNLMVCLRKCRDTVPRPSFPVSARTNPCCYFSC